MLAYVCVPLCLFAFVCVLVRLIVFVNAFAHACCVCLCMNHLPNRKRPQPTTCPDTRPGRKRLRAKTTPNQARLMGHTGRAIHDELPMGLSKPTHSRAS